MNRKEKISYIQRCITDKKINHNYIKTFIEMHEIKYTENMNGSFVNLSILNDELIDLLYDYIFKNLNNKIEIERNNIIKESIEIINKPIKKQIEKKKVFKQKTDLTETDLKIIELSKTI